jgi:hypothetical protein
MQMPVLFGNPYPLRMLAGDVAMLLLLLLLVVVVVVVVSMCSFEH